MSNLYELRQQEAYDTVRLYKANLLEGIAVWSEKEVRHKQVESLSHHLEEVKKKLLKFYFTNPENNMTQMTIKGWANLNEWLYEIGDIALFRTKKEAESAWGNQSKVVRAELTIDLSS